GVEQLEHALGRCDAGLQQVRHRGQLRDWLAELTRVLDERLHVTEADDAVGHPQAAHDGDGCVAQVADEGRYRHDQSREELRTEAGLVQLVVALGELGLDLALPAEHLDDGVAGERLLDMRVERARAAPLVDELRARATHDEPRDDHGDGDAHEGHQRQYRRDREHHDEHEDHREQRGERLAQRLLQALGDVVDVVGDAAEQLPPGLPVEVTQWQAVDLLLDVLAQAVDGALHDLVEDEALEVGEQRRAEVDREGQQEHPADGFEVDADTGHEVDAAEHLGDLILTAGPGAFYGLLLGEAGGQLAADDAREDQIGRPAQHPWADGCEA